MVTSTNTNADLLLKLLDKAETTDEVQLIERLWRNDVSRVVDSRFVVENLQEVAEFFGTDEHTVRQWRLRPVPMPGEPGKWPVKDIVKWRCDWLQQAELSQAKKQQEYELGQIALESKRIELARETSKIVDRADVELWAATALTELRESVMRLPEMLAASAPEELKHFVREETDRHCRDILTATARRLEMAEIGNKEQE